MSRDVYRFGVISVGMCGVEAGLRERQWLVSVLQMYSLEPASHNILKFVHCAILAFLNADTGTFYHESDVCECRYCCVFNASFRFMMILESWVQIPLLVQRFPLGLQCFWHSWEQMQLFFFCVWYSPVQIPLFWQWFPLLLYWFWHSPRQIPLYLQWFCHSCVQIPLFSMISMLFAAIPAFSSTDIAFHNSFHCVHNDSRMSANIVIR